jgi:hypothetical protein
MPAMVQAYENPDCIFPSDNDLEVPTLKLDGQVKFLQAPHRLWGSGTNPRNRKYNSGTWFFYTEDYRFENLWKHPEQLLMTGCTNASEINFSCYAEMPLPIGFYQIYRKRWIARYWQEYGVKILVDMNVNSKFFKMNLLGVPKGWRAYCTRGYNERVKFIEEQFAICQEQAESNDILFVVYGGGKLVRTACQHYGWIHIVEEMERKLLGSGNEMKLLNFNQGV